MEISEIPLEHIKIYDLQKFSLEEFLNFKTNGEGPVGWADGIVYWMAQGSDTEFLQKELIEKHTLHIMAIDYADMPTYLDLLKNKHGNQTICVDQSSNPIIMKLATYLKERDAA